MTVTFIYIYYTLLLCYRSIKHIHVIHVKVIIFIIKDNNYKRTTYLHLREGIYQGTMLFDNYDKMA